MRYADFVQMTEAEYEQARIEVDDFRLRMHDQWVRAVAEKVAAGMPLDRAIKRVNDQMVKQVCDPVTPPPH